MAVQMTNEQLQQLIAGVMGQAVQGGGAVAGGQAAGAAAVVGQMAPCQLGRNKMKRYKRWNDWILDAENKMGFLSITNETEKIGFLCTCAGAELTDFWTKEARVRFTAMAADEI